MIIDATGTRLIPGNEGKACPGNGEHLDQNANKIECCCDNCEYYLFCFPETDERIF